MIYGVFVVRDMKTGYLTPTIDINKASAMRNFEHAMMQKDTLYYSHPQDYQLVYIGEYDSDVGVIEMKDREILLEGRDFKRD